MLAQWVKQMPQIIVIQLVHQGQQRPQLAIIAPQSAQPVVLAWFDSDKDMPDESLPKVLIDVYFLPCPD